MGRMGLTDSRTSLLPIISALGSCNVHNGTGVPPLATNDLAPLERLNERRLLRNAFCCAMSTPRPLLSFPVVHAGMCERRGFGVSAHDDVASRDPRWRPEGVKRASPSTFLMNLLGVGPRRRPCSSVLLDEPGRCGKITQGRDGRYAFNARIVGPALGEYRARG